MTNCRLRSVKAVLSLQSIMDAFGSMALLEWLSLVLLKPMVNDAFYWTHHWSGVRDTPLVFRLHAILQSFTYCVPVMTSLPMDLADALPLDVVCTSNFLFLFHSRLWHFMLPQQVSLVKSPTAEREIEHILRYQQTCCIYEPRYIA